MTDEYVEGTEAGEDLQEEVAAEAAPPEESSRPAWHVPLLIAVIAVLFLCTAIVCCAAASLLLIQNAEPTALPPAATEPAPAPVDAYIRIDEPVQGAVVDIAQPVTVSGMGAGLPEGNVVVQVLDAAGNVLAEQATILQGENVGTGGEGTWSLEMMVEASPGTAGSIYAFSPSPLDNSIVASDQIQVSLGQTAAVEAYVLIEQPAEGTVVDLRRPIVAGGMGAGLPEGNVVVQVYDASGNLLAEQPTVLQGEGVGTGGEGVWSVEVPVEAAPGTAGIVRAFSPSPLDGSIVAADEVQVSLGQAPTPTAEAPGGELEGQDWLLQTSADGAEITARFEAGQVSGKAACNNYFGSYTVTPGQPASVITFGEMATTRMMCEEDVMAQEQAYLAALSTAAGYSVQGDTLSIYHPGGTLVFTAITASQ